MSQDPLKFTGKGFSENPLTPEELAEQRERNRHYDEHFLDADEFLKKTGLAWLANAAKGFRTWLAAFLVAGSVAAAWAAITKAGWF